jgi:hypothetical protein
MKTNRYSTDSHLASICITTLLCCMKAGPALAGQFTSLDPAYTQQIYAGPNVGLPGAWMSTGEMLARKGLAPDILEYSTAVTANAYQGTNLHQVQATHTISGLASGNNLARAMNGFLYLPTTVGLQRVDSSTWGPAVTVTSAGGPGYGVNSLPNGNVVYAAGFQSPGIPESRDIHIFNPSSNLDSIVYTSPGLIDDIETSLTGFIALAGQQRGHPSCHIQYCRLAGWPGIRHDGLPPGVVQQR